MPALKRLKRCVAHWNNIILNKWPWNRQLLSHIEVQQTHPFFSYFNSQAIWKQAQRKNSKINHQDAYNDTSRTDDLEIEFPR